MPTKPILWLTYAEGRELAEAIENAAAKIRAAFVARGHSVETMERELSLALARAAARYDLDLLPEGAGHAIDRLEVRIAELEARPLLIATLATDDLATHDAEPVVHVDPAPDRRPFGLDEFADCPAPAAARFDRDDRGVCRVCGATADLVCDEVAHDAARRLRADQRAVRVDGIEEARLADLASLELSAIHAEHGTKSAGLDAANHYMHSIGYWIRSIEWRSRPIVVTVAKLEAARGASVGRRR